MNRRYIMDTKYVVIVIEDTTATILHTVCGGKGVSKEKAERIANGVSINLDHARYSVRIVPCV